MRGIKYRDVGDEDGNKSVSVEKVRKAFWKKKIINYGCGKMKTEKQKRERERKEYGWISCNKRIGIKILGNREEERATDLITHPINAI